MLTTKSSEPAKSNSKRACMAQKGSHSAMNTRAPVLTGLKPARLHRDQRRRDAVGDGVSVRERENPPQQIAAPLHQTIIPLENQSFHLRPDKSHELVFPKSSELQFRNLLIELFRQEVNVSSSSRGISNNSLVLMVIRKHDKVCDTVFLEKSLPIDRRSSRHAPSVNAAGKLRDL